jgi:hypothetical protein
MISSYCREAKPPESYYTAAAIDTKRFEKAV